MSIVRFLFRLTFCRVLKRIRTFRKRLHRDLGKIGTDTDCMWHKWHDFLILCGGSGRTVRSSGSKSLKIMARQYIVLQENIIFDDF